MRIIFMGTPDYALAALEALYKNFDIIAVYCKPPKPQGRGMQVQKCETHQFAEMHSIPVYTPKTLRSAEEKEILKQLNPDIIVVAAYGLILPKEVLEVPRYGCINIHASILPKWRGASPIHHALLAGDKTTGITTMLMDEGIDTGDILLKEVIDIADDENIHTLYNKLKTLGAKLIVETIKHLGDIKPEKQNNKAATFAPKALKEDAYINVSETAERNLNRIRAFYPAKYLYKDEILNIYEAKIGIDENGFVIECSDGPISVQKIQRPGKRILDIAEFMRGLR